MRYPPVCARRRSAPCGRTGDAAKTGNPAMPSARYNTWLAIPRRAPSAAPPSSTTIGVSVNGTGVNGSGTLICAATAVNAVTNSTAATLIARSRVEPATRVLSTVGEPSKRAIRTDIGCEFYCMHTALTIAGSDSGGGAGIQADLKTFAALGVYGTSAITAVTAQNTVGVNESLALQADLVTAQIEAIAADIPVHATKTGMLATAAIVEAVAAAIRELDLPLLVVDPVLVSKSGARLLDDDGIGMLRTALLPRALVVTPNIPEAEVLIGRRIQSIEDARAAAYEIHSRSGSAVVIKGGHADGEQLGDLAFHGGRV